MTLEESVAILAGQNVAVDGIAGDGGTGKPSVGEFVDDAAFGVAALAFAA